VTKNQKQWLSAVPWESVVTLNNALCQAQKVEPLKNARNHDKARQLWERSSQKQLTVEEAFTACRDCHELAPFTFNNGNTFAAIGRTLVEDHLNEMPPVEAQIFRTTIGHYIVGLIGRKEMQQVLRHFEPLLNAAPPASAPQGRASATTTASVPGATGHQVPA
jgi:hypothetical protein